MSEFEDAARREKALKLARWLYMEFMRVVAESDEDMWAATAARAGVKHPSEQTRAMVIDILRTKGAIPPGREEEKRG